MCSQELKPAGSARATNALSDGAYALAGACVEAAVDDARLELANLGSIALAATCHSLREAARGMDDKLPMRGMIAQILADPDQHKGQTYPLFGPVEVTPPEIAAIVSQTLGKDEQWVSDITGGASVPFLAQHLDAIAVDHANGIMAGTNDLVETIGGRRPMTVAEYIEKHRAAFP